MRNLKLPILFLAVCCLTADVSAVEIPVLTNSASTFLYSDNEQINVFVDLNGNPNGTMVELEIASGTPFGPTEPFIGIGLMSSNYVWNVNGLNPETSYWFRSRAYDSVWSDYSDIAVWSTDPDHFQILGFKGYHLLNVPVYTGAETIGSLIGDDVSLLWMFKYKESIQDWIQVYAGDVLENNTGYFVWCKNPPETITFNGIDLGGKVQKQSLFPGQTQDLLQTMDGI